MDGSREDEWVIRVTIGTVGLGMGFLASLSGWGVGVWLYALLLMGGAVFPLWDKPMREGYKRGWLRLQGMKECVSCGETIPLETQGGLCACCEFEQADHPDWPRPNG